MTSGDEVKALEVETVTVEMQVPKESKEVVDLVDGILEKALAKSDLNGFSELLGKLMSALDGVQKVPAEILSQNRDELAGYLVQKVMSRLAPVGPLSK